MDQPMGNGCVNGSPNVGNGNNVRNINPTGNVNNNNANNSNGVAPDCGKRQHVVSEDPSPNPVHSRKERLSSLTDEHTSIDAVILRDGTAINNAYSPKERICSFEELYKAAYICKRNVMWKDSVAGFVKTFGVSFEYALYEISFANLLLYSSTLPSYELDKEGKKGNGKKRGKGEVVNGDDPKNKDLVKAIIGGYKF